MNTVTGSFNTDVRQMTEMSQQKMTQTWAIKKGPRLLMIWRSPTSDCAAPQIIQSYEVLLVTARRHTRMLGKKALSEKTRHSHLFRGRN